MTFISIIWKGKGWQIALVTFLSSLFAEIITRIVTNDINFYQNNPYPLSLSLLISSAITYLIFLRLKRENEARNFSLIKADNKNHQNLINSSNNEESKFVHEIEDSLFFIPIKYWIFILLICSVINILRYKL